jgi:hypothetical protein
MQLDSIVLYDRHNAYKDGQMVFWNARLIPKSPLPTISFPIGAHASTRTKSGSDPIFVLAMAMAWLSLRTVSGNGKKPGDAPLCASRYISVKPFR